MVLSSERKNATIIRELNTLLPYLSSLGGNLKKYGQNLKQTPQKSYSPHLIRQASEMKSALKILGNVMKVLKQENVELEKDRELILKDPKRYRARYLLRATKKNAVSIRKIKTLLPYLASVQGNLENYAAGLRNYGNYSSRLVQHASEIRRIIKMLEKIMAVLKGEDIELAKEWKILSKDAQRYSAEYKRSIAEA